MRAEWEKQKAILLALPHKKSDWKSILPKARKCFANIIHHILQFEEVWVCADPRDKSAKKFLQRNFSKQIDKGALKIFEVHYNDTWVRDYGVITLDSGKKNTLLNFGFNGWGLKYAANYDNALNSELQKLGVFNALSYQGLILEGGSIDCNGAGLLLTNTQCLLQKNRNPHLDKDTLDSMLCKILGVKKILWLHYGFLRGDDTDSHIDTLVRFIDERTIAYTVCEDSGDEHYKELQAMQGELCELKDCEGRAFNLVALPLPKARFYQKERKPASYVNFLFVNGALLVPTYNDSKNDKKALEILQNALPHLQVIGIPCMDLIKWNGSLHCATMQIY